MATEREITELKKKATDLRDKIIQAKGTYTEVVKNVDLACAELEPRVPGITKFVKECDTTGLNSDQITSIINNYIDPVIKSMEDEVHNKYVTASEKIDKWYKK